MANYKVTDSELSGIASAIRLKGGTSDPLVFPSGFVSAISAIETKGTYISKIISENGEYDPASDNADAFSHVTVSVPSSSPIIVSKNISENGTYNPAEDNADAYSQVVVNVPSGGGLPDFILTGSNGSIFDNEISDIRPYAFYYHSGLKKVNMNSVKTVNVSAFANCTNLSEINLQNCEEIKTKAFCATAIISASFPECLKIGANAFNECYSLKEVYLPKVSIIANEVFSRCSVLSSVNIDSCQKLSGFAFASCVSLRSISLPNCSMMSSSVFTGCTQLESVYLLADSVCVLPGSNVFANTPITKSSYLSRFGSIFVPASLVESYKSGALSAISDRITAYVEE